MRSGELLRSSAGPAIELDPGLVEESVLRAIDAAGAEDRRRFRAERNALYEQSDNEAREIRFRELHLRWFEFLRLGEPIREILAGGLLAALHAGAPQRCVVLRAPDAKQEGADLHDSPGGPVLAVRLRPGTLLHLDPAAALLRRELLHVADMLDPGFGYCRELPGEGSDPARDRVIRQRYKILWDISVDGRLAAQGLLPPETERSRRRELESSIPLPPGGGERETFDRLFFGPRPGHAALCALAEGPGGWSAPRCTVCDFPTRSLHEDPASLDEQVVRAIQADRPAWRRELGLCLQCADLYTARCAPAR